MASTIQEKAEIEKLTRLSNPGMASNIQSNAGKKLDISQVSRLDKDIANQQDEKNLSFAERWNLLSN